MEISTVMALAITVILAALGFVEKNSLILFLIQALWMYLLLAGDTASTDMGGNETIYWRADYDGSVYQIICTYARDLGLDYLEFNALLCVITFGVLVYCIKHHTQNPCLVMSLIFFYPLMELVIQKRWMIASVISILAMFLLLQNTWKSRIVYIGLISLASNIHAGAIGYYLFLLYPLLGKFKQRNAFMLIFLMIMLVAMPYIPNIVALVPNVGEARAELYFGTLHEKIRFPILNTVLWSGFHLGWVYLFHLFINKTSEVDVSEASRGMLNNLYYINFLSLLIIPLYYWEPTFWRLARNIVIMDHIAISILLPLKNIYRLTTFKLYAMWIVYTVAAFFLIYFGASAGYEFIVEPIFSKNVLWS